MTYADMVARSGALQSSFTAVARIPKPVVAAVTGYALGGGCELALCADFRVCGDNAKLGQPEIQLGVIPGAGGTQRLPRLVGPARAKDIIFTGRFVDAEEALRIGLVDKVVPADEVYAAAVELAARFVGGPALALRAAKEAIDARPRDRPRHRPGARAAAVLRAVRHRGPADRHGVLRRARPRQGRRSRAAEQPMSAPNPNPTAAEVERAWTDPKLANVLYHDWEATTYDEKWSISYDERCIDYARDRFAAVAGSAGWPYAEALELGSGTGFFLLNLMQAGVADHGHVTDLSPGMVEAAVRNGTALGLDVDGRVADAESHPVRRRERRPRGRARGAPPHPGRRARAARGAAGAQARRPVRLRR